MEETHKDKDGPTRVNRRQLFRIHLLTDEHDDVIRILNECSHVMRPQLIVDAVRYFQANYVPSLITDKDRQSVPSAGSRGSQGGTLTDVFSTLKM